MKDKLLELPIEDFAKILTIITKENEYEFKLDFYSDLLVTAKGYSIEELEELPIEEHEVKSQELMAEIVDINQHSILLNEIRIGTKTYYTNAVDNKFSFKTKEFKLIQKIIGTPEYVLDFAAIIWREKDGELTQTAIDVRKEVFKQNLKIKHIISYINLFTTHLLNANN